MPAVLAQVRGDAVRAGRLAHERCGDWIRLTLLTAAIACFPQSGDVIDVYP